MQELCAICFCSLYPVVILQQKRSSYYTSWTRNNSVYVSVRCSCWRLSGQIWDEPLNTVKITFSNNKLLFINISRRSPVMPKAKSKKHLISSAQIRPFVHSTLLYSPASLSWQLNGRGMLQRSDASHGNAERFSLPFTHYTLKCTSTVNFSRYPWCLGCGVDWQATKSESQRTIEGRGG